MFSRGLIVSFGVATLGFVQVVPIRPVPQAASIAAVTPTQGPIAGGTRATISGVGFSGAIVHIDGQDVTPVSLSDTAITVQMPPHDNGYAVIAVAAPGSATSYTRFLYMPPRLIDLPPGSITTVAGVGVFKGDFAAATEATVGPLNLALDSSGNIYVAEPDAYHVSRIRTDGILERFAGSGAVPNSQNCCRDGGPASQAPIGFPRGVAIDDRGGLLIADKENHRIRRVDTRTGVITTIAGTGARGFSGDGGPATAARLSSPTYVTSVEGRVYFVDFGNNRVRGIDPSGVIATVAGNGSRGFSGDGGPATDASFDLTNNPDDSGIAADRAGNLFLIDQGNHRIRKIDPRSRLISTLFEVPQPATRDPLAMATISAIGVDADGNVYYGGNYIAKLSPGGAIGTVYGMSINDFSPDGTAIDRVRFGLVTGIAFDRGDIVYSDQAAGRVRRLNFSTGQVETIAGSAPARFGENGPALGASLKLTNGSVALTSNGDLLIADERIRRVDSSGNIRTIAGLALRTSSQNRDNVPALDSYNGALALFVNPSDEIDTASFMSVPYRIDRTGTARVIATRTTDCGYSGDGGRAIDARLCQPWDIARDRDGHIFIADTNNNRIRRVDAITGVMSTFAGTGPVNGFENYLGSGSYCGDGGPAINACFNTPYSVAFDPDGNLFVSDSNNRRIRRIDGRTGIISTFVETQSGRASRGVTTIRFDRRGFLYTHYGDRIVRYDPTGRMEVLAGIEGRPGFSGDGGPALQATVDAGYGQSAGLAIDDDGTVYFVDPANRRVRAIRGGR